jgi:hypothetical protein
MAVSEAETLAWQRARRSRRLEVVAAIFAGGVVIVMLEVFYSILSR